ncbi:hypothetical protein C5167_004830 [Papaver somniferum]|uniref:Thioesterase domain-containing protein n=1 Tax=Papaver somniferum TaxID=3469 RepID=A0A4Y7JBZ6_PAPSO|nr:uncharacterized protein LOC113273617 [Papaver somniferum]RZC57530.1 hypothetical protein C5167_004830 [Papaver somniferum]
MSSSTTNPQSSSSLYSSIISPEYSTENYLSWIYNTYLFLKRATVTLPDYSVKNGFFSDIIRDLLKVDRIERGRVACFFTVKSSVVNTYGTLHGGAVGVIAELVSLACARTFVAKDKDLFLGELSISYLAATGANVELEIEGCVARSGRNITTTSVDFRIKESRKMVYTARATFYATPVSNL